MYEEMCTLSEVESFETFKFDPNDESLWTKVTFNKQTQQYVVERLDELHTVVACVPKKMLVYVQNIEIDEV